jgi:hypothetical protein
MCLPFLALVTIFSRNECVRFDEEGKELRERGGVCISMPVG